jgi:hypothetical protein
LIKIGQSTVSSIDEDTPTATKLKTIYNQVLDEALAAGPEKGWKFAQPEEDYDISVDATSPGDSYEYRYKLPDDFLRATSVKTEGTEITDWVRKGQYILTNQEDTEIELEYVKRVTVTGLFPPHFIKVLYYMLAYHLAYDIVQNKNHANDILQELQLVVLPKAIGLDEQDQYVQEESTSWIDIGRSTSVLE